MADKYIDIAYSTQAAQTPKQVRATITAISKANGAVVTAANDFTNGDVVAFASVAGMTEINGRCGTVASASGTGFTATGIDSTAFTTYTSGGVATKEMTVTNDIRVLYKDTLLGTQVVDALQRAKEILTEVY